LIKNFVFDLGNVLVDVNVKKFVDNLEKEGLQPPKVLELVYDVKLKDLLESGKIDFNSFYLKCKKRLNANLSRKRFSEIFNDMFSPVPEMAKILNEIKKSKKYKIFLLSNTNSLHFNFIRNNYDYINLIDRFALSYRLKAIKPDSKIYLLLASKFKIVPEETVFIDDLKENCEAAKKLGFNVIHFANYDSFKQEFYNYFNFRN
jgi:glucose-1-phosphatase